MTFQTKIVKKCICNQEYVFFVFYNEIVIVDSKSFLQ